MWAQDRHRRIHGLLHSVGQVSTDALAREFGVSHETVRRDLLELEAAGALRRVHGGAVMPGPKDEAPFAARLRVRRREKQAIARAAAALIQPGQVCFVDAGSTTALFAAELARIADVTVITNSIDVAGIIRRLRPESETILLGGKLNGDVPGTYGELTMTEIARFRADLALLSPVGLNAEQGATDFVLQEAEVARAMTEHSRKVVLLADHSKLGAVSRVSFCACPRVDILVTDARADAKQLKNLRAAGVGQTVVAPT